MVKRLWWFVFTVLLSQPALALTLCIEDADYSPFLNGSPGAAHPGVLVELVQMAAAANHTQVILISHPWKRCIDMLSKGQVDAIAASIWLPEREAWGVYPKRPEQPDAAPDRELRLWHVEYPIFVSRQSTLSYDGQRFEGVRTGLSAPSGYVVWQRLKDAGVLHDTVLLPKAGLNLVALNRLDGYVVERNIGQHLLHDLGIEDKVTTLPTLFDQADWYLVFSHPFHRANTALAQRIWQSVGELREQQGAALLLHYQP